MAEIKDYSTTADNNNSASPNGMPEGMAPGGVNNSWREQTARIKRWYDDVSGINSLGGGTTAYTLAASRTISSYAAGDHFVAVCNATNTGAVTLNVDSVGARSVVTTSQTALGAGQLVIRGIYVFSYDATNNVFIVLNPNLEIQDQPAVTSLSDSDEMAVHDGALKKITVANLGANLSVAADNITTGDAAVSIATSAGNITVDAQGNDTDIILKGTDGGADTTFLTLDGSAAGEATFNAGIVIADGGNIGSASDKDALAIAANGVTTFSQIPVNANNPALEARITSNQSGISHNTYTKINLNSTLYDVGSFFDTSTNYRYTPTVPGYYWFNIAIYDLSATDVYDIIAVLYKNGAATTIFGRHRFLGVTNDDLYSSIVSASGVLHMDGDDYAELYCRIASEDSGSITVGSYYTRMSAFLMSRTS